MDHNTEFKTEITFHADYFQNLYLKELKLFDIMHAYLK